MSDSLPPPAPPAPRPRSGRRVFAAGALSALLLIGIIGASVVIGFRLGSDAEESNLVTPTSAVDMDTEGPSGRDTAGGESEAATTKPAAAACTRSSAIDTLLRQVSAFVGSEIVGADSDGDR